MSTTTDLICEWIDAQPIRFTDIDTLTLIRIGDNMVAELRKLGLENQALKGKLAKSLPEDAKNVK